MTGRGVAASLVGLLILASCTTHDEPTTTGSPRLSVTDAPALAEGEDYEIIDELPTRDGDDYLVWTTSDADGRIVGVRARLGAADGFDVIRVAEDDGRPEQVATSTGAPGQVHVVGTQMLWASSEPSGDEPTGRWTIHATDLTDLSTTDLLTYREVGSSGTELMSFVAVPGGVYLELQTTDGTQEITRVALDGSSVRPQSVSSDGDEVLLADHQHAYTMSATTGCMRLTTADLAEQVAESCDAVAGDVVVSTTDAQLNVDIAGTRTFEVATPEQAQNVTATERWVSFTIGGSDCYLVDVERGTLRRVPGAQYIGDLDRPDHVFALPDHAAGSPKDGKPIPLVKLVE